MSEHGTTLNWRRSTYCSSNGCVEVARGSNTVHVRDTKDPDGPQLTVSVDAWRAFIASLKRGDLGN
jgi:hypothetical protein